MRVDYRIKMLLTNRQSLLIFTLTLVISTLISAISLLLYYDYRDKLDKELNQPIAELLQINRDATNREFRQYDNKAVQLSYHPSVVQYVSPSLDSNQETIASIQAYVKAAANEDEVHSIYVVDLNRGRVLSSNSEKEQAMDTMGDRTWIPWSKELETKPLLITRRSGGGGPEPAPVPTELISLIRPIRHEERLAGLVIINIDYDRLFTGIHANLEAPQYIFSLDGELIYPKTNLPIKESDMRRVVAELSILPFKNVRLGGQDYLANQTFSDMTGWRWVSVISLEDLLKNARLVRNIIVMLSLLSILIGCVAMCYSSYTAFRPLARIRELVGYRGKPGAPGDWADIERHIWKLVKEADLRSALSKQSLPEVRSKYVQDVLLGRIGAKEIRFKWQRYFEDWSDGPLTAAVISISRYKVWSADFNEEDQLLLKYALSNLIHEMLDLQWHSASVALDKENVLIIVQPRHPVPEAEKRLQERLDQAIESAEAYLRMQLSIGIGRPAPSIAELHRSYAEANEALAARLYEGYGKTFRFAPDAAYGELAEARQEKLMREWLGQAEAGDAEALAQGTQAWSETVASVQPPPESVYAFAERWLEALLRLCSAHDAPKPPPLEDYTPHQLKMMDLADVTTLLLQASRAAAESMRGRLERKERLIVQRIIQFMSERLKDNIGLQDVAESVGMSVSSVSSIFRQETGYSVFEYLTLLRIEEACRLLTATERKVADIASQVGYQNETSFIRSFRKVKGMTPGKYREVNRTPKDIMES
ncbi:helix-turn-helix domain-containing protein [Paenibacillus ginsengihumi]|uniref:helix-turn-helix domain-containing protein n=1 Tax=Paenibacillus ginsengihumi TaxID=431596 RepID=UPI000373CE6A|nr:helix-turn-helix domain-containing protein [Paenibacillus ginsengihumi]